MELKNKQILEAQSALTKLSNTNLPAKQAYKINKTMASMRKQLKFIQEQQKGIIKKYGKKTNDGNYEISESDKKGLEKYYKDFDEVLQIVENIDVRTLTIDDIERVELTANELDSILFMIEETEE